MYKARFFASLRRAQNDNRVGQLTAWANKPFGTSWPSYWLFLSVENAVVAEERIMVGQASTLPKQMVGQAASLPKQMVGRGTDDDSKYNGIPCRERQG